MIGKIVMARPGPGGISKAWLWKQAARARKGGLIWARSIPTTRPSIRALSPTTWRSWLELYRLDAWRGTAPLTDARLAAYLGAIFEAGRAPATAARPRTDGRGVESPTTAHRRGRLAAVRWADVTDARDGDGVLSRAEQN